LEIIIGEKMKKEKSEGLTDAQKKKLPPALLAAMSKKKSGKKHMDADDEGLDHPEKADLDKDGKLSSYEKKRAKAIEDAMDDDDDDDNKKKCGMYMDKDDEEEEEEEECTCGCDDPKDCTCGDKKESRWTGSSLPTFNEWLKWRNNINEKEEGVFGVTGNPAYPYAARRGPDVSYNQSAANMNDDQVMEIFRKAKAGLDAFSAYAQMMAMRGDMAGMEARDAAYEALAKGQHPEGFGAFKKTGYTGR
jgi:hypothetical protein